MRMAETLHGHVTSSTSIDSTIDSQCHLHTLNLDVSATWLQHNHIHNMCLQPNTLVSK